MVSNLFQVRIMGQEKLFHFSVEKFPSKITGQWCIRFFPSCHFSRQLRPRRKSGIIFGKIFCGFERGNAGMKLTVGFEIDFDSVHCMYLLDLLYLYDTIYILYCQYPIGTFLTYVRLEKNLSGTKFPARSFRTLVYESGTPARAREKFPAQLQLQLPAQLPAGGRWWVGYGCIIYTLQARLVL